MRWVYKSCVLVVCGFYFFTIIVVINVRESVELLVGEGPNFFEEGCFVVVNHLEKNIFKLADLHVHCW